MGVPVERNGTVCRNGWTAVTDTSYPILSWKREKFIRNKPYAFNYLWLWVINNERQRQRTWNVNVSTALVTSVRGDTCRKCHRRRKWQVQKEQEEVTLHTRRGCKRTAHPVQKALPKSGSRIELLVKYKTRSLPGCEVTTDAQARTTPSEGRPRNRKPAIVSTGTWAPLCLLEVTFC